MNIIICRDGTDNQFGRHNTNVVKLYQALESSENQKCFYDPGVGTYTPAGIIKNLLGKAFGTGLTQNIEDAYRYLMNIYRPGDRIYNKNYNRKTAAAFKQTYCRKCVPCFIGVWDTVASLGYFLGKKFFDDDLHGKITYGYQAAAIDKKRKKGECSHVESYKKRPYIKHTGLFVACRD